MALSQSSSDDVSDVSRVATQRWVTPALFSLWGAAAIAEILIGHVVTGVVIATGAAVAAALAVMFRRPLAAFNRRQAAASQATYGSLSLIGIGWMLLGLWRLVPPTSNIVLGGVCVGMGLIMVLAYAPAFFQRRSLDRNR
ncbi:hypothetical protein [Microbacterium deminutum]